MAALDLLGTSRPGRANPLVPCAVKVGSHAFPFVAIHFAIQDASPLQPAKVKPRVAPGGAGEAAHLARANNSNRIDHGA